MRSLRRSLAFSVTAVVTAGLGIGATAAIVSAGYAILVRPLPFPQAERLVSIYSENPERGWSRVNISYPDYLSWRVDLQNELREGGRGSGAVVCDRVREDDKVWPVAAHTRVSAR